VRAGREDAVKSTSPPPAMMPCDGARGMGRMGAVRYASSGTSWGTNSTSSLGSASNYSCSQRDGSSSRPVTVTLEPTVALASWMLDAHTASVRVTVGPSTVTHSPLGPEYSQ